MNGKTKNRVAALLAGAAALCLGGAVVCYTQGSHRAFAADAYEAFVNIGATEAAAATDTALNLTKKGATATVSGTVTEGDTLFGSYATGATYSMAVAAAGKYQVAVAVKAEAGKTLTVAGKAVSLEGKSGNTVVTVEEDLTDSVEVAYDGALCGVLVAGAGSHVLLTADYTPGQVIRYGVEVAPQLENATGYYSDGTTEEIAIEYGEINAGTGINVNFTTIDVTGTITVGETELTISRYLTTMPDGLVYFINCGSSLEPEPSIDRNEFNTEADYVKEQQSTIDGYYSYNQTIFDYYGTSLINYGTPDRSTTSGGDWGYYTNAKHFAPGDATFPYNSAIWTGGGNNVTDMGYMLSGLNANTRYRVWFGTLSHWHARTVNITFNGQALPGYETLRIPSSKSFSIFENIEPDASGKVNIHMTQVGSENEPTLCFIAVQPMSVEIEAAPAAPQGPSIVGLADTSITLTNVTAGAALRLYNEAKPNQLLYEETVDAERINEADGSYVVDWGEVFTVSQFRIVEVTPGGVSASLLVSITDIRDFRAYLASEAYTTGTATVCVEAVADSGIVSWSYRFGEYGEETVIALDRPFKLEGSFEAEENGDYYIVVTSGLGVTYSESISVGTIDPAAPVIDLTPSEKGWKEGSYNVTLGITAIAPVTEYKLYQDGKLIESGASAPEVITLKSTGEYLVSVKTAAGQSTSKAFRVSGTPVTTVVRKSYDRRQLQYAFGDSYDYIVYSVTAYELRENGVSKMTITNDNKLDVYDPGTYVVTITTTDGAIEMFALEVEKGDFNAKNLGVVAGGNVSQSGGKSTVGIGIGVGVGGVVLAVGAVLLTHFLTKKKKDR